MHPQPSGLLARRKAEPCAQVEEDIGGLRDDKLAGLEERRRKRRARDASPFDQLHHGGNATLASPARHVDIVGAGLLQGEANEFAAALDRRPVVKFIAHDELAPRTLRYASTYSAMLVGGGTSRPSALRPSM